MDAKLILINFFQREPLALVYLTTLILITIFWITKKRSLKSLSLIFLLSIFLAIAYGSILIWLQYKIWKENPISSKLLPPYQDISYFLSYSLFHFFRDFWFRLIGALLTLIFIHVIIFILKRDPFFDEEKILIPLLVLLFPFPYNAFFLLTGLICLLILIPLLFVFKKIDIKERVSPINLWLFLAWIFTLMQPFLYQNVKFILNKP